MKLKRLKLRGAIGLKRFGDEIEIDFRRFDQGVISLVGENGAGKTTILENLHPWPSLVTRSGSLCNHFELRDSLKELELEYAGHDYLCKVLIDSQNGKLEAYFYRDGSPLNDGKVPSYKKLCDEIFGQPSVFFRSVFAGQNGEKITALGPASKKEFFVGLLGLERYQKYSDAAKSRNAALDLEIAELKGTIERLERDISANETRLSFRARLETEAGERRIKVESLEVSLAEREGEINTGHAAGAKRAGLIEQIDRVENDIAELQAAGITAVAKWVADLSKCQLSLDMALGEVSRLEKVIADAGSIRQKAERLKTLRAEHGELSAKRNQVLALEKRQTELGAAIDKAASEKMTRVNELDRRIEKLQGQLALLREKVSSEIFNIEQSIKAAQKIASGVETVPCRDQVILVTTCPLLANVRVSQAEIPALLEKLQTARDNLDKRFSNQDEIDRLATERNELVADAGPHPAQAEFDELPYKIAAVGYDIGAAGKYQSICIEISSHESENLPALLQELDRAEVSLEERRREINGHEERKDQLERERRDRIDSDNRQIEAKRIDLKKIEAEVNLLPAYDIQALNHIKNELDAQLRSARSLFSEALAELRALDSVRHTTTKLKSELEGLRIRDCLVKKDASEYRLLESACGKNGLQALELDAAGPAISSIATEMIQAFGREWAITISTVRRSADNKKDIETFEIIVSTPGGVKNFDDLSGGEKVWVEESLRKAVTIYLIKNSGRDYRTIFQDESDGPLDPERALAFLDTSLRAHELCGAYHTIIITQRPEIWQRIPQRIHLNPEKGAIEVVQEG